VKIYIPGRGSVDSDVYKVDKAVNQYNERLSFRLNEDTGDYCIYMRMPRPEPDLPILGFGVSVPHPDVACKKLWESDTMIHGEKILDDILKSQAEHKKRLQYDADQASSDSSERVEKFLRGKGLSPVVKVFTNDKKGVVKSDD
tara:strand:- start:382 stop:810 length:429 start_codon:yes stop_codon:yes gene_type:complete